MKLNKKRADKMELIELPKALMFSEPQANVSTITNTHSVVNEFRVSEQEARFDFGVPYFYRSGVQLWTEDIHVRAIRNARMFDPAGIVYQHWGTSYKEGYTGKTHGCWTERFANKKIDPNTRQPTNYIEINGDVHPNVLFLTIIPRFTELAIQTSLLNRATKKEKYGSITYYDDYRKFWAALGDWDGSWEDEQMYAWEDVLFHPFMFNDAITNPAHLSAFLTKQQAIDWANKNYADEDEDYFYLTHYKERHDVDVRLAHTYATNDKLLKLSKALEYTDPAIRKQLARGKLQ